VVPKSSEPLKVSASQQKHRLREAQELFARLQYLLFEVENPGTEMINDALKKS
jgi:hypothetical protein